MDLGIATIGSGIVGGILGYGGARNTNAANERIANARNIFEREEAEKARDFSAGQSYVTRDFNRRESELNRQFQNEMSSTAVSRRMADMRKAGINPILAGKYDASTPAGSMASGSPGATAKANSQGYTAINEIQPILDNLGAAIQLKKLYAEAGIAENTKKATDVPSDFISETGSEVAKDMKTGYRAIKGMLKSGADAIGNTASDIKHGFDQYIYNQMQSIKKGKAKHEQKGFKPGKEKGERFLGPIYITPEKR